MKAFADESKYRPHALLTKFEDAVVLISWLACVRKYKMFMNSNGTLDDTNMELIICKCGEVFDLSASQSKEKWDEMRQNLRALDEALWPYNDETHDNSSGFTMFAPKPEVRRRSPRMTP